MKNQVSRCFLSFVPALLPAVLLAGGCSNSPQATDAAVIPGPDVADAAPADAAPADAAPADAAPADAAPADAAPADAAPADAAPQPILDTFIVDVSTAICGALYRCCNATDTSEYFAEYQNSTLLTQFRDLLPPADQAACTAIMPQMLAITPWGDWVAAARAGRVELVPEAFAGCIDTLGSASCGTEVDQALYDSTCFGFGAPFGGPMQRSMFARTSGAGAECAPIRDGSGGAFYGNCDPSSTFCCYVDPADPSRGCTFPFGTDGARTGTCAATSLPGERCSVLPLQLCATGHECDLRSDTCRLIPTQPLAVGEACMDADLYVLGECQDSWCDVSGTRLCQPLVASGGACSQSPACASGHCRSGVCVDRCVGQ